jgi:hypothetical protein
MRYYDLMDARPGRIPRMHVGPSNLYILFSVKLKRKVYAE